jgi:RNA polymerase sigma factor (sigma-70 family)
VAEAMAPVDVRPSAPPEPRDVLAAGSADAFGSLIAPYRRELLVHAYRMLGSIDDAEDAVQDALVRSWNGRSTFQRAISFRAWLYRITTNACLDAIERRRRRRGEASLGVGPMPDQLLDGTAGGPEARHDLRESISLAFLTALQVLPPRQRAVLILRDVLVMRAAEVAALLEMTVPAVNGALLRARATIATQYRPVESGEAGSPRADRDSGLRVLVERYVRAWEAADIPSLVALLRDDAMLRMPPDPTVVGAAAMGAFMARTVLLQGSISRLVELSANGEPVLLAHLPAVPGETAEPFAVLRLVVDEDRIARIDAFTDPRLIARFAALAALAASAS